MSKQYDVAIVGAGVLGVCMAYWISSTCKANVCVIDKERLQAEHASSRNTGVMHSPFYLDPKTKSTMAKASLQSYPMWEKIAIDNKIPWKKTGLLELAIKSEHDATLEKYSKWAKENGILEEEILILDAMQVKKMEPHIQCHSALYCSREVSTDFGALTRRMAIESQRAGAEYMMGMHLKDVKSVTDGHELEFDGGTRIECDYMINCAGANSLDIAKMSGSAKQYTDMHFRGEYWVADEQYAKMVETTVYTVAKYPNYPFLDPHWIKKADGTVEVGPNAVPVLGSEMYSGYVGDIETIFSKMRQMLQGGTLKLLTNPEFMSLISKEWHSSLSKSAMINRIRSFIPNIRPEFFLKRGTAGIRTPLISPEGKFVPDVLVEYGTNSIHILNYNSPGATGAPFFAKHIVRGLCEKGILEYTGHKDGAIWKMNDQD
ncbi:MAG: FAD-dependent oxidoreductase [Cenarchaeum symbiont of Oopsacas minuta]|nr:FAD-dependent oxidoreductase [Cenarchaeum symbiont of Oopsacas minuta]